MGIGSVAGRAGSNSRFNDREHSSEGNYYGRIFSRALRITDKQFVTTRSLYECDTAGITDQISWLTLPVMQTVIVVAHNPTLTMLAEQLTRGTVVSMVPCAIVSIVFPAGTQWNQMHEGDLEFCADPTGILP